MTFVYIMGGAALLFVVFHMLHVKPRDDEDYDWEAEFRMRGWTDDK